MKQHTERCGSTCWCNMGKFAVVPVSLVDGIEGVNKEGYGEARIKHIQMGMMGFTLLLVTLAADNAITLP